MCCCDVEGEAGIGAEIRCRVVSGKGFGIVVLGVGRDWWFGVALAIYFRKSEYYCFSRYVYP